MGNKPMPDLPHKGRGRPAAVEKRNVTISVRFSGKEALALTGIKKAAGTTFADMIVGCVRKQFPAFFDEG
jgi:hypothetical protein